MKKTTDHLYRSKDVFVYRWQFSYRKHDRNVNNICFTVCFGAIWGPLPVKTVMCGLFQKPMTTEQLNSQMAEWLGNRPTNKKVVG